MDNVGESGNMNFMSSIVISMNQCLKKEDDTQMKDYTGSGKKLLITFEVIDFEVSSCRDIQFYCLYRKNFMLLFTLNRKRSVGLC